MPKSTKGKGGKNRRRGKADNDPDKRELVFKEEGQEYAQVTKMLGGGHLETMCFDNQKRQCKIRGKLRKKVWINLGDIILISLRNFEEGKADVLRKYTADEARSLKAYEELPEHAKINGGAENFEGGAGPDNDIVVFDHDGENSDEEGEFDYAGI